MKAGKGGGYNVFISTSLFLYVVETNKLFNCSLQLVRTPEVF